MNSIGTHIENEKYLRVHRIRWSSQKEGKRSSGYHAVSNLCSERRAFFGGVLAAVGAREARRVALAVSLCAFHCAFFAACLLNSAAFRGVFGRPAFGEVATGSPLPPLIVDELEFCRPREPLERPDLVAEEPLRRTRRVSEAEALATSSSSRCSLMETVDLEYAAEVRVALDASFFSLATKKPSMFSECGYTRRAIDIRGSKWNPRKLCNFSKYERNYILAILTSLCKYIRTLTTNVTKDFIQIKSYINDTMDEESLTL